MSRPEPRAEAQARPDTGRRRFLATAGTGLLTGVLAACGGDSKAKAKTTAKAITVAERNDETELNWKEARKRLEEGNARFVAGKSAHPDQANSRRKKLESAGQKPYVCVLACADSRVPPEVVFDQGLGDLFVVRSAGQVLDTAVLGTLQFGVEEFETPLLVVLGHTKCGAVKATVEAIEKKSPASGTAIDALVAAITPSVEEAKEMGAPEADLVSVAVDNNIERVVQQLSDAKILSLKAKARRLKIVGALYDLATGEVTFQ
jgi:carbonic anhydrase